MEKDKNVVSQRQPFLNQLINKALSFPLFKTRRRLIILGVVVILGFIAWQNFGPKRELQQYQTATVEKGTLVTWVNESGQVAVANRASVITQATGVISEVDVKNGDTVTAGQQIAAFSLDSSGQQKQAQALSSYLSAKSAVDSANAQLYSLQSTMFSKWKIYSDLATNSTYQNPDSSPNSSNRTLTAFTTVQDDWFAAEAVYKNQQGQIAQAQAALNSSWLSYQLSSNIILAPLAGKITDLTVAPGTQIGGSNSTGTSSNSTSSTSNSSQIASIVFDGNPVVTVSLSEIDVAKVKADQKATITFDALPNKSFTGKVLGINTTGSVSSGVTTYPATIVLDLPNDSILPNMSVTANIIINVKDNVLLVPSSAVQTAGGESMVRVLKDGQINSVQVEIGSSSDTQTEITSGLNEGDTIITSFVSSQNGSTGGASPFSSGFRIGGGGMGGGGNFNRGGGGR